MTWVFAPVRGTTWAFAIVSAAMWAQNGWSLWSGVAVVAAWHLGACYAYRGMK